MSNILSQVKAILDTLPPFKAVVGCSGGVDSVVLVHVLRALNYPIILAHVNHGWRGRASDWDEEFVQHLAQKWMLSFESCGLQFTKKGNLEALGRDARYSFLEQVRQRYQADFIAVGHHFDDQIETVLMHRKRGAGLRGERGMLFKRGHVIRPLLNFTRAQIEVYAKAHHLEFRDDASNRDTRFERNRLRHEVIPELKKDPDFVPSMRRSIQSATEKMEELENEAATWLSSKMVDHAFSRATFSALQSDVKIEILFQLLGPRDLYSTPLKSLVGFIKKGQTGKRFVLKGTVFHLEYEKVHLNPEKTGSLEPAMVNGELEWGNYHIQNTSGLQLIVRSWQPGDRFQPSGMQGHKKLQDYFVDEKIPASERKQLPIIVDDSGQIICVGSQRFDEKFKDLESKISVKKPTK